MHDGAAGSCVFDRVTARRQVRLLHETCLHFTGRTMQQELGDGRPERHTITGECSSSRRYSEGVSA
jgi:hypothetical protein